ERSPSAEPGHPGLDGPSGHRRLRPLAALALAPPGRPRAGEPPGPDVEPGVDRRPDPADGDARVLEREPSRGAERRAALPRPHGPPPGRRRRMAPRPKRGV